MGNWASFHSCASNVTSHLSLIRMYNLLRCIVLCLIAAVANSIVSAQTRLLEAPNVVPISATLVTSGQPTAASLAQLSALGFGGVIYLALPTVSDAVPGEAEIVKGQGLAYVNIPIPFGKPTSADFQAFVTALAGMKGRKVLVHCQVNLRASSLVFLHRVIVGKESPETAYQSVISIWSPEGPWKALIVAELRKNGISFEPY